MKKRNPSIDSCHVPAIFSRRQWVVGSKHILSVHETRTRAKKDPRNGIGQELYFVMEFYDKRQYP